jgi:hypothetical protein
VLPPLVGLAVNTTDVPLHTLFVLGDTDTAGATDGLTVMVTPEDVAVLTVAHVALLVSCTVTTSPLFSVDELNEVLLVPAFTPFTFH